MYVLLGLRKAPEFIRRAALIIPFYVVILLFIGYWNEIRYWIMVYPLLISLGLAGMYHDEVAAPAPQGVKAGIEELLRPADPVFPE